MSSLKEIGVGLAMDDFGTGYSSLACLGRFPVDYLKIDQAFVRDLGKIHSIEPEGSRSREVVNAIISLARAFGIKTIAEGVETEEQLEILRSHGCDQYQGYLLGKPMDAAELLAAALGSAGGAAR